VAEEKEYFAFISYQRKDEEWADRLRNKLEHYRLPSSVRKQDASLPKEIRPIFRDALELAGGVLAKEIEIALQQSKYLIVICSPNSAKSPWVNKEIQTFIDLGREDHIIPFIIDGTPFSDNPDTECFPPVLRSLKGEKELLGININELSRDAAAIKVVARMFGLKFDTLWQRYEREKKRTLWMIIGSALLFALISLGIAGYIYWINERVMQERNRADEERERANSERKRAEVSNMFLLHANDSIKRLINDLQLQKDKTESTNLQLILEQGRLRENKAKLLVTIANEFTKNGNGYLATLISLNILNHYPDMPEAEAALRMSTSSLYHTLDGRANRITNIDFCPNSPHMVSTGDRSMRIWNVETGKCEKRVYDKNSFFDYASYSPSGKLIVSNNSKIIRIWDSESAECIDTINYKIGIGPVFLLKDETKIVALSSNRRTISVIDRTSKQCIRSMGLGVDPLYTSLALSPDGELIACSKIGKRDCVEIWNVLDGHFVRTINSSANDMRFSNNGKMLVIGNNASDGPIKIWDVSNGKCLYRYGGGNCGVHGVSISNDMKQVTAYFNNGLVQTYELGGSTTDYPINYLVESSPGDSYIRYNFDGRYMAAVGSRSRYISVWGVNQDMSIKTQKLNREVLTVCYSPDTKNILSGGYNGTLLWDTELKESRILYGGTTNTASYNKKGDLILIGGPDKELLIWQKDKNSFIDTLKVHKNIIRHAIIMDDSIIVSLADKEEGYLWNYKNNQFWKTDDADLFLEPYYIYSNDLHVHYIRLRGDTAFVYCLSAKNPCFDCLELIGHSDIIQTANYSQDGKYIVTASKDKTIKVWNSLTGSCCQTFIGHTSRVNCANFSPDGRHIVSSSEDYTIKIWEFLPLKQLIKETCERFKDCKLTPEERQKYYLE